MKAIWNGEVIAESDDTVLVEGNHYFPAESVDRSFVQDSARTSYCPWKGTASYYDVVAGGEVNKAAAWYYPEPKPKAEHFRNYVAFWAGVRVEP